MTLSATSHSGGCDPKYVSRCIAPLLHCSYYAVLSLGTNQCYRLKKVYPADSTIRSTVISWPAKVQVTPELPKSEITRQQPQLTVHSPIIRNQQRKSAEVLLPQNSCTVPHSAILFHAPFGPKIRALNIPLWGGFLSLFLLIHLLSSFVLLYIWVFFFFTAAGQVHLCSCTTC